MGFLIWLAVSLKIAHTKFAIIKLLSGQQIIFRLISEVKNNFLIFLISISLTPLFVLGQLPSEFYPSNITIEKRERVNQEFDLINKVIRESPVPKKGVSGPFPLFNRNGDIVEWDFKILMPDHSLVAFTVESSELSDLEKFRQKIQKKLSRVNLKKIEQEQAIVRVEVRLKNGKTMDGSGVVVFSEPGKALVASATHGLLKDADKAFVIVYDSNRHERATYSVLDFIEDKYSGGTILKIEVNDLLPTIPLPRIGRIFLRGAPVVGKRYNVNNGFVNINLVLQENIKSNSIRQSNFTIKCAYGEIFGGGCSGSPLISDDGELVGIYKATLFESSDMRKEFGKEFVNSSIIRALINRLKKKDEKK